ncbi:MULTISPECIES: xylulokinase [Rhizobium]|uniref:Pentose kinase n=1 Tax=Rhizobium leguminosarum bv. viciae TaxID=387 RepID=A0A8G2IU13_RHILV|nr:FGGY family carbohydrate kinase [Rhizobium leguminosarum]MBY5323953.1 pentose kinase [Rhizobium leguminosarum]MBY5344570.1 pentose kinase [Rhizobium leguminosarum]MBY5383942.1 pentose kinase [Rhizobium leguminosarum]MBY5391952.1 pentose kinase [Rhizobium leguminosarum]MBY5426190.1 pentose kinase [Rhizobium leguminosarum]
MSHDLFLAIDVGTGSVRAALVDTRGRILAVCSREHEQIVPQFGWAEQRPDDWWTGVVAAVRGVLDEVADARSRVVAIAACGQMHGTVLVGADGALVRETAPLWNDKRTVDYVTAFEAEHAPADYLADCANPPTPAWPGFKLQWLRDNDPSAYRRAEVVLMPKDYVNLRLTGEIAMDRNDGGASFLMDPRTGDWSQKMIAILGLDANKLAPLRNATEILGRVSEKAAIETGLRQGTPVLVGGADYPVALLGSGVCRPGVGSEVMGTSAIITAIASRPLLDPSVCNVGTVEGNWGAFMLLESGGDAMRWARRAFDEKKSSYEDIVFKAAQAPAGSDRLFFMPYLTGERLGQHRNARAQYFGIGAAHGLAHMHRAVLEGVAFAVKRHINILDRISNAPLERIVASGGGAKAELWMKIKASVYGIPILVPREPECGLVGCAIMAAAATEQFSRVEDAADAFVSYEQEIPPDPLWAETYRPMQEFFEKLYTHSQVLYDDLDRLAQ